MKRQALLLTSALFCYLPLSGADLNIEPNISSKLLKNTNINQSVLNISNCILVKVRGKSISLLDVVKKMDVIFFQRFPEYADSAEARYQFYTANWRGMLQELIDKELVMADAEEMKIDVSHGDVRQELEMAFGPSVTLNLNKINLSYDDAWEMMESDILLRRMMMARVRMKAYAKVHPSDIRAAYQEYASEYNKSKRWHYRVLSIRHTDQVRNVFLSDLAHRLLSSKECPLEEISGRLSDMEASAAAVSIKLSEPYVHNEKEISASYQEIISALEPGSFSKPIAQESRAAGGTVYRIFYLEEISEDRPTEFASMEKQIQNYLMEKHIALETENYITHLHKHFDMDPKVIESMIPGDFQPFTLN
jgi:hypothetical protein